MPYFQFYSYIMARVKLSPLLTDISGSIGGLTIQRNKFGVSMRSKPLPYLKSTDAQNVVRTHMVTIQAAWQALTDSQRLQWNRFLDYSGQSIRRDRSIKLSGHALYIKYQMYRLLQGYSLYTTISYAPMQDVPSFNYIDIAAGPIMTFALDSAVDFSEYFFNLKLSYPRRASSSFSPKGLRLMYCTPADSATFIITSSYSDAFGFTPAIGTSLDYSLVWFSDISPVFSGYTTGRLVTV